MVKRSRNSGQALLVVLLSLSVVLIVVLYIASRSITDITISSKEEDSLRAFSAAEAGIERALVIGEGSAVEDFGGASFDTTVINYAQGKKVVVYPIPLQSGDSATFWFVEHNSDGSLGCTSGTCFTGNPLRFCWGENDTPSDSSTTPALELTFFYTSTPGDYQTTKTAKAVFDPSATRRETNNFENINGFGCTVSDEEFEFYKRVDLDDFGISAGSQNVLQFVRARILYNTDKSHKVGLYAAFSENSTLPSQGSKISSLGTYAQTNRKIQVYQLYPEIPSVFENAVYGTAIVK